MAELAAKEKATTTDEKLKNAQRWVTFKLDREIYGINVTQVKEVLRMTEVAPVPGAPSYVLGIINLRGNVVTVMDGRKRLNLPPIPQTDASRIVITEINGNEIGFLVDSVSEVVDITDAEIDSAPSIGGDEVARYINGVTSREEKLIILIDVNKLVSEEELKQMKVI